MFLNVNGVQKMIVCDPEVDTLADVLRRLGLTGVKIGCGKGQCGTCTVILNGKVVRSCTRKIKNIEDNACVETIEGLGSASHPHPLQKAMATYNGIQCGFCTPGFIMSAKGLLAENPSPTRNEVRAWFQKNYNACRCTGYKTIVDAVMAAAAVMRGEKPIESLDFSVPADGTIYGTNYPRPSAMTKALGAVDYGADINEKLPDGSLYLAPVFSGVSHGRILRIDCDEALSMEGVVQVITAKDVKGSNRITVPVGKSRSKADGNEWPILADEKVYRYGDICALVAATSRAQARAAAKKVVVNIQQLQEYMTVLEAVADDAMQIHDGIPNVFLEQPHFWGNDTASIMDNAEYVAEDSFYTQREPHLVLEPECALSYYDDNGNLTIQYKSQFVYLMKSALADGIGMPRERIRIIGNPSGSSFGYTMSPAMPALMGVATIATGKPCALTMSYEEHQRFTGKRAASYSNIRMACDSVGKLQAMEYEIAFDMGPYPFLAGSLTDKVPTFMGCPYTIPNVKGLSKTVFTNHCYQVNYRSYGVVQTTMATEQIMDELAEKLGMDPFEFRYLNVYRPGDYNANGNQMDSYNLPEMMDLMRPEYIQAKNDAKKLSTSNIKFGVGFSCSVFKASAGANDQSEIYLELNPDGTVTQFNTWAAMGQGSDIGTLIHTYEALRPLGLRPDQIKMVQNDTKFCPNSGPAAGSRSHFANGNATIDAANKLMDAMRKPDGSFRTYDEMIKEGIATKYSGVYSSMGVSGIEVPNPNTGQGRDSVCYAYSLMLALVSVELATGKTKVERFRCLSDVGQIGSVHAVEGQAYSGIMHGIGTALSEDYSNYKKHSNIMGAGFPYIEEIPDDVEIRFMDTHREAGPYGSAGCAESYQSGPHSAVISAIYDACGIRIKELPATPDKIVRALERKAMCDDEQYRPYYLGCNWGERLEEMRASPV